MTFQPGHYYRIQCDFVFRTRLDQIFDSYDTVEKLSLQKGDIFVVETLFSRVANKSLTMQFQTLDGRRGLNFRCNYSPESLARPVSPLELLALEAEAED